MRLFFLSILLSVSLPMFCQTAEVLDNRALIEMTKIGFSDDVIISKIDITDYSFDTSIDSLKYLKENGVSDDVILHILQLGKTSEPIQNGADEDSYNQDMAPGLYFIDTDTHYKRIYPTFFSGNKTNTLGTALSYGLASSSMKSTMIGSSSANKIKTMLPNFLFVFNDSTSITNFLFSSENSPHQYVLVSLDKKNNRRELKTGSINLFSGTSFGIDEKSMINFNIEKLRGNEFLVRPSKLLSPGEYCFIYKGIIPYGGTNQQVFDFTITGDAFNPAKYPLGSTVYVTVDGGSKKCKITDIQIEGNQYIYFGEDRNMNVFKWTENLCTPIDSNK